MQVPPDKLSLDHYNGTISLFSPSLPFVNDPQLRRLPGHITLLTPEEYKAIGRPTIATIASFINMSHIYLVGQGQSRDGQVTWECVVWNDANRWRLIKGLERKQFHVTTSPRDDHSLLKGIDSAEKNMGLGDLVDYLEYLSLEGLDEVCRSCGDYSEPLRDELAMIMVIRFPKSYKGYIQLAKVTRNPKVRQLSLAQAIVLNPFLAKKIIPHLSLPFNGTFGPVIMETEVEGMPVKLHQHLFKPWPEILQGPQAEKVHQRLWIALTPPRESVFYLGYELPRNFSWIYPFRVAGMSTPRNEEDVDVLKSMGITDLLSLNKEGPLSKKWFRLKKIKHHYIPIENYGVPTLAEMDIIYDKVMAGGSWVIHCGGGVGRAGTILACLITMLGDRKQSERGMVEDSTGNLVRVPVIHSDEAIRQLRIARPKSIETNPQAAFVSKWVSHRWKLLSQPPPLAEPLKPLDTNFEGKPINPLEMDNTVLFLIGKPGSGKSFLAEMIVKRRIFRPTIVISQDDCGSKDMCEKELSREWPPKTLIIFDRCNPSVVERASWLKRIPKVRRVIAIHFDMDTPICRQRMNQRLGHPTIRAGRGVKALGEMDQKMEPPTLEEGFSTIVKVESLSAARTLVADHLTLAVGLRKFPQTPHLIDLGAATDDDLVCDIFPHDGKMEGQLIIEEKIDGANLGICLNHESEIVVQNRSHLLHDTSTGQFKGLRQWIETHSAALYDLLQRDPAFPERYILYGEWCQARHTIPYDSLDDRFMAFDLYDRISNSDCSRRVLTKLLKGTGIRQVPFIRSCESITREEVLGIIQARSAYISAPPAGGPPVGGADGSGEKAAGAGGSRTGPSGKGKGKASASTAPMPAQDGRMEGVYIRFENADRTITEARGKVVRGDFIRTDDKHWSKRNEIIWNKTKLESGIGLDSGDKVDRWGNRWNLDLVEKMTFLGMGLGLSDDEEEGDDRGKKPMGREPKKIPAPPFQFPRVITKVKVKRIPGKMEKAVEKHVEKVKNRNEALVRNRQGLQGPEEGMISPGHRGGAPDEARDRGVIPEIRVMEWTPEQERRRIQREREVEQERCEEGERERGGEAERERDGKGGEVEEGVGGGKEGEGGKEGGWKDGDAQKGSDGGMGMGVDLPAIGSGSGSVLSPSNGQEDKKADTPSRSRHVVDIKSNDKTDSALEPAPEPGLKGDVGPDADGATRVGQTSTSTNARNPIEPNQPSSSTDPDPNLELDLALANIPESLRLATLNLDNFEDGHTGEDHHGDDGDGDDDEDEEEDEEIRDIDENAQPVWGGFGDYRAAIHRAPSEPIPEPDAVPAQQGTGMGMGVGMIQEEGGGIEIGEEDEEEEEEEGEQEEGNETQITPPSYTVSEGDLIWDDVDERWRARGRGGGLWTV